MLRFHYLIQYFCFFSFARVLHRCVAACHTSAHPLPPYTLRLFCHFFAPFVHFAKGVNLDIVLRACDMNIEQRYLKRDRNIETKLSHSCLPVFLWIVLVAFWHCVAHSNCVVISLVLALARSVSISISLLIPVSCCHCFNFFLLLLIKIIEWHEIRKVFNSAPPEYIADLFM